MPCNWLCTISNKLSWLPTGIVFLPHVITVLRLRQHVRRYRARPDGIKGAAGNLFGNWRDAVDSSLPKVAGVGRLVATFGHIDADQIAPADDRFGDETGDLLVSKELDHTPRLKGGVLLLAVHRLAFLPRLHRH